MRAITLSLAFIYLVTLVGCGNNGEDNVYQQQIEQKKRLEKSLDESLERHNQQLLDTNKRLEGLEE